MEKIRSILLHGNPSDWRIVVIHATPDPMLDPGTVALKHLHQDGLWFGTCFRVKSLAEPEVWEEFELMEFIERFMA